MFRIHKAQIEHFSRIARTSYRDRLETWLLEEYSDCFEGWSQFDIRDWVEEAVTRAESHSIDTEPETTQLVLLFLVVGLDADETIPWFQETLEDSDLYPVGKIRRLLILARSHNVEGVDEIDLTLDTTRSIGI